MVLLVTALLMSACHSSKDEELPQPEEDCFLDIYVYAPNNPIITRADVGEVKVADESENRVKTLKIWVFRHSDVESAPAVGYLEADPTFLNQMGQQKYQLKLDKDFANKPKAVDVYAVANEASANSSQNLGKSSTRTDLNAAKVSSDKFGVSELVSKVPDEGLPMSAILKDQPISGKFPTLHIGSETEMATMQLTRVVSKLRFVLSREQSEGTDNIPVSIKSIKLDAGMIPATEYLFLANNGYRYNVGAPYNTAAFEFLNSSLTDINSNDDPMQYAYQIGKDAQAYEELLATGIGEGKLTQVGPFYLRESDKRLSGTITYQAQGSEERTVTFRMSAAGDFTRNHTWTVYAYYGGSRLEVVSVFVNKWIDNTLSDRRIHNW